MVKGKAEELIEKSEKDVNFQESEEKSKKSFCKMEQ